MATALATKPAPPHQKIKRPPPPVQTSVNGVRSSQSSPSPSLSSKRPSGFKHPPSATVVNGVNGNINGGVQRSSNRKKDSQRPGDTQGRPIRVGKNGQVEGVLDRKNQKRKPEPYSMYSVGHLLAWRNMLNTESSSQRHTFYSEEIPKCSSFADSSSPPHSLSIRTTGWQFLVQFSDENHSGTH